MPWREPHEIELALRSSACLKVLKVLLQNRNKYLSKYYIAKETGLYNPSRIIENLVKLGWIEVQEVNNIKRYRTKMRNPNVRALYEFFIKIGYL